MVNKVNFGIKKLDELIGHDLGAGSNVLIIGPSGSGKTILGFHFLFEGIKNGESVLFLTLLEPIEEVEKYAKSLGFDVEKAKKKGLWHIIHYSPRDLIEILKSGSGVVCNYMREKNITRIFIDNFTTLIYLIHIREDLVALDAIKRIFYNKPKNATLIISLNDDDFFEIKTLVFMADVVIRLKKIIGKGEVRRIVYIDKMRSSRAKGFIYEYDIQNGTFKIGPIFE